MDTVIRHARFIWEFMFLFLLSLFLFFYLLPFPPISFSISLDFRVLSVRIAVVAFISAFSNYFMPSWTFNPDPPDQPLFLKKLKNPGVETYDSLLGGVNNSVTAGMLRKLCPGTHGCPISPKAQIEIASYHQFVIMYIKNFYPSSF